MNITDKQFKINNNFNIFEILSTSKRQYNRYTYYFSTNIIDYLSNSPERKDKDIEFPKETINGVKLCLDSEQSRRRKSSKNKSFYHLYGFDDLDRFEFTYKGVKMYFQVNTFDNIPHGIDNEILYQFRIYYPDYNILNELSKSVKSFYQKYIKDAEIDEDTTIDCYINEEDFWNLSNTRNKRSIDTIYIPKKDKQRIIDKVKNFNSMETIKRYRRCGILHKLVCLFHGVPGSGKTSFVTAIASEIDYDIASFNFEPKTTDKDLNKLVSNLPEKTILLLEDMDCLFKERKENDSHKNAITLSGILNILDGLNSKEGMIVFITTNHKEFLYDPALIRPGRIDISLKFENIKIQQVKEMYKVFMEKSYCEEQMNKFIDEFKTINFECSTALLQQYLFIYMDQPEEAIKNIHDMKDLYRDSLFEDKKYLYT